MQKIKLVDFAGLESLLSSEEVLVMNNTRDFVNKEIIPIIDECYMQAKFPAELIPKLGAMGFLGAPLEGHGCPGLGYVAYGLINMMLEAADSAMRSFNSVQTSLVMLPISEFGTEAQKSKWLAQLAAGTAIGCFGLTEPDHGSNPSDMETRAEKIPNGYKLNGAKMWITNGSVADIAVVWAKLDGRIRGFLVEKNSPGFSTKLMTNKHSLRASVTSELIFADCIIPETNLLPKTDGLKSPFTCLNSARLGIAWGSIGAAMACYQTALDYAMTRVQFNNQPIASHQLIQLSLADMISEITKAQFLTLHITRLKEKGTIKPEHISMLKRNNVRMALDVSRKSRDILGANGISAEYPVMRHMCNLESVLTYEGTENIHTLIIGKSLTGISAF
ncbi:MAG: acyl-CoA dehydrogenase family protein [Cyanobacteria bacterium]|nr:acyl-CoA dehydrogenase family protein [Cyanobacteriota bacterium]MDA1020910.1 acyl-CoA dehydrogenase family protein [Cyanobacteriota bacterium]